MPISSTEISSIIQSQVGMFSASAAYAHAVSAQYGYQSHGGMGVNDPRSTAGAAQAGLQAGAIGGMAARAPGMALGGLSAMAMFGFGPRILDPFTMGAHMVGQGYARQGIAGAVGMGGLAFAGAMGVGAIGNFATSNMVAGAQNRGMLNSQMAQIFPGMNSQGLGAMSAQVEAQARMGMGNLREITSVMQQGVHSGAIDSSTLSRFSQSFNKLMSNVRQVATVMNTSLQQAQQAMQSVSGMGITGDQAAGFLGTMKAIGQATNISPQGMMAVAQAGAQFGQASGIDMGQAATGAMVTAGVYGYTERNKLIKGITGASQGRYTGAATRFLGSRYGQTVLGAMMTSSGGFDMDMAQRISSGNMSWSDIKSAYSRNISGAGQRDMLRARSGELAGQFISEFGPQSISGALGALRDTSSSPETLMRSLTGLNRNDLRAMEMLSSNSGQLRSKMMAEARAGFDEGTGRVGFSQIMSKAIDELTKPIRQQFQKLGANLTQYTQDALQDVGNQFMTGGRQANFSRAQLNSAAQTVNTLSSSGNTFALNELSNRMNLGVSGSDSFLGRPDPQGFAGQFVRDFVPTGFQIGSMSPGTSFSDLPGYGLGLEQFQPGQTAFAIASAARVLPGGRNIFGAGGAVLGDIGQRITGGGPRGYTGLFGGSGSGFMGMGGHGLISGTGRLAGGAMRLGGALMRGGGSLLGALGPGLLAYDMVTNSGQEGLRMFGQAGISQGAITGNNARLIESLAGMGVLGEGAIQTNRVGQEVGGLSAEAARTLGLTPIAGTFEEGASFGVGGTQRFLTESGMTSLMNLDAQDQGAITNRLGGSEHIAEVVSQISGGLKPGDPTYDRKLMKQFMEKTGATSREAYLILSTHGGTRGGAFKGDLRKTLDVTKKFRNDPEGAGEAMRQRLTDINSRSIAGLLISGSEDSKSLAKEILGSKDLKGNESYSTLRKAMGVDEEVFDQFLSQAAEGGGFNDKGLVGLGNATALSMQPSIASVENLKMSAVAADLMGNKDFSQFAHQFRLRAMRGENRDDLISDMVDAGAGFQIAGQLRGMGTSFGGDPVTERQFYGALLDDKIGVTGNNPNATAAGQGLYISAEAAVTERKRYERMVRDRASHHSSQSPTAQAGLRISAMRGGYTTLTAFDDIHAKFKKGLGTVDADGNITLQDFEQEAMKDFAGSLLGDKEGTASYARGFDEDRINRLSRTLAKGGSDVERRMAATAAKVSYYTETWEKSKNSPANFLSRILHNPEFNKLTDREKNFLKGTDRTGYTTRLEGMLMDGAREILVASGKKPTTSEVENLTAKLIKGSETTGGDGYTHKDLITDLSTNMAPVTPGQNRGGGAAGAQETVTGILTALDGLRRKLEGFTVPGQNMSYGTK